MYYEQPSSQQHSPKESSQEGLGPSPLSTSSGASTMAPPPFQLKASPVQRMGGDEAARKECIQTVKSLMNDRIEISRHFGDESKSQAWNDNIPPLHNPNDWKSYSAEGISTSFNDYSDALNDVLEALEDGQYLSEELEQLGSDLNKDKTELDNVFKLKPFSSPFENSGSVRGQSLETTVHGLLRQFCKFSIEAWKKETAGRFSAKSRAWGNKDSQVQIDDEWGKGIQIGGKEALIGHAGKNASTDIPSEYDKPDRHKMPDEKKDQGSNEEVQNFKHLNQSPKEKQEAKITTKPFSKRDRGKGQKAAMDNLSAFEYACLADPQNKEKHHAQRWEWLHIRAASLDGATDSTNMVAGHRDVNTQMMPVESNILQLGRLVAGHNKSLEGAGAKQQGDHDKWRLKVTWELGKKDVNGFKHFGNEISINWVVKKEQRGKRNRTDEKDLPYGRATFKPLEGDRRITYFDVDALENELEESRKSI